MSRSPSNPGVLPVTVQGQPLQIGGGGGNNGGLLAQVASQIAANQRPANIQQAPSLAPDTSGIGQGIASAGQSIGQGFADAGARRERKAENEAQRSFATNERVASQAFAAEEAQQQRDFAEREARTRRIYESQLAQYGEESARIHADRATLTNYITGLSMTNPAEAAYAMEKAMPAFQILATQSGRQNALLQSAVMGKLGAAGVPDAEVDKMLPGVREAARQPIDMAEGWDGGVGPVGVLQDQQSGLPYADVSGTNAVKEATTVLSLMVDISSRMTKRNLAKNDLALAINKIRAQTAAQMVQTQRRAEAMSPSIGSVAQEIVVGIAQKTAAADRSLTADEVRQIKQEVLMKPEYAHVAKVLAVGDLLGMANQMPGAEQKPAGSGSPQAVLAAAASQQLAGLVPYYMDVLVGKFSEKPGTAKEGENDAVFAQLDALFRNRTPEPLAPAMAPEAGWSPNQVGGSYGTIVGGAAKQGAPPTVAARPGWQASLAATLSPKVIASMHAWGAAESQDALAIEEATQSVSYFKTMGVMGGGLQWVPPTKDTKAAGGPPTGTWSVKTSDGDKPFEPGDLPRDAVQVMEGLLEQGMPPDQVQAKVLEDYWGLSDPRAFKLMLRGETIPWPPGLAERIVKTGDLPTEQRREAIKNIVFQTAMPFDTSEGAGLPSDPKPASGFLPPTPAERRSGGATASW